MISIRDQSGITLLEVIFALFLVLLLFTAFTGALVVGLQTEGEMNLRLEARLVIDDIIEFLRNNQQDFEEVNWEDNINEEFEFDIKITDNDNEEVNNKDIIIVWNKTNNLYKFNIKWPERNYSIDSFISAN